VGTYPLTTGLYIRATGQRLPLSQNDTPLGDAFQLTTLTIQNYTTPCHADVYRGIPAILLFHRDFPAALEMAIDNFTEKSSFRPETYGEFI
jgi:hypothetical protein